MFEMHTRLAERPVSMPFVWQCDWRPWWLEAVAYIKMFQIFMNALTIIEKCYVGKR